ncbi:MAG: stage II sporulation protein M [Isosphaeraceae bacterium]
MNPRRELENVPPNELELDRARGGWFGRRRFSAVYLLEKAREHRSNCSRLALARSMDLPDRVISGWSKRVAVEHAWIYRPARFEITAFFRLLFRQVPFQIVHDRAVWLAFLLFYGLFFGSAFWCAGEPGRAEKMLGPAAVVQMEKMYESPISERKSGSGERNDSIMAGFYIRNNAGIGLQCFGWGLAFGLGSVYILCSNALQLGSVFGHMATTPHWDNFSTFVTAHSSYELTAICLSAAAGLRMGYGLVETGGLSRTASLRKSSQESLPLIGAATVLFILAAFIEGFFSASDVPYSLKLQCMILSALSMVWFVWLGLRKGARA